MSGRVALEPRARRATPARVQADPRFRGAGVTIAIVDAAFYPHPDLVRPYNRIRVWVDASQETLAPRWFGRLDVPVWPEVPGEARAAEWHGLMTSAVAAGNGGLSGGRFRAVASESDLALVQVGCGDRITNEALVRALRWLRRHAPALGLRVVNLSVGGDPTPPETGSEIDDEVEALVADGVVVVAAAGNDGIRRLLPPATSVDAITVGGVDDRRTPDRPDWEVWHSNFGRAGEGAPKPELLAQSVGLVAPTHPGTRDDPGEAPGPAYHIVDGTSVAAPIIASVVACMIEANPALTPEQIKTLLMRTATPLMRASADQQGAGVVDAGRAVALALAERITGRRSVA